MTSIGTAGWMGGWVGGWVRVAAELRHPGWHHEDVCTLSPGRRVRLGAIPQTPAIRDSLCVLEGEIPVAQVRELDQQLPALTRGEGVLETTFGRYQPVRGTVPVRPRSDRNPLNRNEYLLHVARRRSAAR